MGSQLVRRRRCRSHVVARQDPDPLGGSRSTLRFHDLWHRSISTKSWGVLSTLGTPAPACRLANRSNQQTWTRGVEGGGDWINRPGQMGHMLAHIPGFCGCGQCRGLACQELSGGVLQNAQKNGPLSPNREYKQYSLKNNGPYTAYTLLLWDKGPFFLALWRSRRIFRPDR